MSLFGNPSKTPVEPYAVPEGTPQIEFRNLRKVYQVPGGEVVALDGINLKIEKGQFTASSACPARARARSSAL